MVVEECLEYFINVNGGARASGGGAMTSSIENKGFEKFSGLSMMS